MSRALAILAMALPVLALAEPGDLHIVAHGASYHTMARPKAPHWNQVNPGFGLRYEYTPDVSFQGGFYKNSFYKQSIYAIGEWHPVHVGPISAGVFGGAASGYVGMTGIAGGALVRWQGERNSVTIRAIPGKKYSIYTIEYGWKF